MERNCRTCNAIFRVPPCYKNRGFYCSSKCYGQSRIGRPSYTRTEYHREITRRLNKGKKLNYPVWNKGKKGVQKSYWEGKRRPEMSGPNHPHWRGGISPLAEKIRHLMEYSRWRSSVRRRDRYKCVLCNSGKNIEVDHHPKLFSQILIDNNVLSMDDAISCEELWDISNGRVLCRDCHLLKTYPK